MNINPMLGNQRIRQQQQQHQHHMNMSALNINGHQQQQQYSNSTTSQQQQQQRSSNLNASANANSQQADNGGKATMNDYLYAQKQKNLLISSTLQKLVFHLTSRNAPQAAQDQLLEYCLRIITSRISAGSTFSDLGHVKTLLLKKLFAHGPEDVNSNPSRSMADKENRSALLVDKYIKTATSNTSLSKPGAALYFLYALSASQAKVIPGGAGEFSGLVGGLVGMQDNSSGASSARSTTSAAAVAAVIPEDKLANDIHNNTTLHDVKLSARASVFNSFYLPQHVIDAGYTIVSECDLVRDLLFVFQGIDGAFIQFTPISSTNTLSTSAFLLRRDVKLAKPTRELVENLCSLGWVYKQIAGLLEETIKVPGLYRQALVDCVLAELQDFKRLVCVLEGHLDAHIENGGAFVAQDLSLKRLFVWTRGPLFRLSALLAILQAAEGKRGGSILSSIHSYVNHGDSGLFEYTSRLISRISQPFYSMLTQWISQGLVDDPYHEFFCTIDSATNRQDIELNSSHSLGGEYWRSKFIFIEEMVPCFIDVALAKKAFLIGKSLDFIRTAMEDVHFFSTPIMISRKDTLEYSMLDALSFSIDSTYKHVSSHLLDGLFGKYELIRHFECIKSYLLLGQGDFVGYLMDSLADTLDKPASTIYRHNLVGVLESAVKISDTFNDMTKRLDVTLLEATGSEIGWEVFALDYKITSPLDTIISPPCMRIFQKLFSFLWRLKRVDRILMDGYRASKASLNHSAHLLRQHMLHFTSAITRHCFQAVSLEYEKLLTSLQSAVDLDNVITCNRAFLLALTRNVMFAAGDQSVLVSILSILSTIVAFEHSVRTSFGFNVMIVSEERALIQEASEAFQARIVKLVQVLSDEGFTDLASAIDYNEIYVSPH